MTYSLKMGEHLNNINKGTGGKPRIAKIVGKTEAETKKWNSSIKKKERDGYL